MLPGDTVWLLGGVYRGDFGSVLNGTERKPIIVRQALGARARIDGSITIRGANTWFWGFEIMFSGSARQTSSASPTAVQLPRSTKAVKVMGPNIKLIHLSIHDLGNGVFAGNDAPGLEIYGSTIYNNGWQGPARGYGHNIYLQNQGADKVVRDNALFSSFGHNLQVYGTSAASLMNIRVDGNTMLASGAPMKSMTGDNTTGIRMYGGGINRMGNLRFTNNSMFVAGKGAKVLAFGLDGSSATGFDLEFRNNTVHGGTAFAEWQNYTIEGNTFTGLPSDNLMYVRLDSTQLPSVHRIDRNRYFYPGSIPKWGFYLTGKAASMSGTFDAWRSKTGYDRNSSFTSRSPATQDIIVRPSAYESGRALVTVWNWTGAASASVDISRVVPAGKTYVVYDALNPDSEPIARGTSTGGQLTLPLRTRTPASPVGWTAPIEASGTLMQAFTVRAEP